MRRCARSLFLSRNVGVGQEYNLQFAEEAIIEENAVSGEKMNEIPFK